MFASVRRPSDCALIKIFELLGNTEDIRRKPTFDPQNQNAFRFGGTPSVEFHIEWLD